MASTLVQPAVDYAVQPVLPLAPPTAAELPLPIAQELPGVGARQLPGVPSLQPLLEPLHPWCPHNVSGFIDRSPLEPFLKDGKLVCYNTGQLMCFRHPETSVLDSLAQSCGLSLPTFIIERICIMPRFACRIAPFHLGAGFSSASLRRQETSADFLTRSCGSSRRTRFERVGTASVPVKTTATRTAAGPMATSGNRIGGGSPSRSADRSPAVPIGEGR